MDKNIHTFITPIQGRCYVCGYSYFNGYRQVKVYLKSHYDGRDTFVLDWLYAKEYKSRKTAARHARRILSDIYNGTIEL